jgi:hypothetical protein
MWPPVKEISASLVVRRGTEVPIHVQDVLPDAAALLEKIPVMAHRPAVHGVRGLPKVAVDAEGGAEDLYQAI